VATLTYAQLEGLWIKAGGPKSVAPVAAAIALAESGGRADALNPNDNGGRQSSFGLWQISNGTHTPPSPHWADPATNASLAVAKFKGAGNNFSPWGTYDSGAYRAYMSGSTTPDMNVPGNPDATATETAAHTQTDCLYGLGVGGGILQTLTGIGNGGNIVCFVSRSQARGIIGAFLMVAGTAGAALSLGFMLYLAGRDNELGRLARRAGDRDLESSEADFPAPTPAEQRRAARPAKGKHAAPAERRAAP
jgi:hypothetical protein